MSMKEKCLIGAGVAVLMVSLVSFVLAAEGDAQQEQAQQEQQQAQPQPAQPQEQPARPRPAATPRVRGGDRPDRPGRGDFQERMRSRIREQLNPSDQEWEIIEPRLTKVMTLSAQANLRMMGFMRGRRGRSRRPEAEASAEEQTEVEKAVGALSSSLESDKPDPADVKAKLLALRQAREKARQELAKAQQELREVLTVEQEARLVLSGMLD